MENDSISSSSSESKLPLIVGIVGLAIGVAGLVLAVKAKSAAAEATATAAAASSSVAELSGQVSAKANATDVAALSADLAATKADIAKNNDDVKAAIAALTKSKAAAPAGKGAVAGSGEYVIAKNDTLGGIAKKLGTSVKSLQELNPGINPNNLKVGSKIKTK